MEKNNDYWRSHKLDFIPSKLSGRISDFENCTQTKLSKSQTFDQDEYFLDEAKKTKDLLILTNFLSPDFKSILTEIIKDDTHVSLIVSEKLYEKMIQEYYLDLADIIEIKRIQVYLYPDEIELGSFVLTDEKVMFWLLTQNGDYDNETMICSGDSAIQLGKEIFDYYKEKSKQATDI